MADQTFFSSLADPSLAKTAAIKNADIFIQKVLYEGPAVYTTATTLFTIAGGAFTVDALISAGVANLLVMDDNNLVASTKITDNTATTITIVPANLLLENDGATTASLTNATTYNIRIYTAGTASQPYGKLFGHVEAWDPQITDEYAKFKYSVPRTMKFKDLLERSVTISGGVIQVAKKDIMTTVFNASEYGDNTGGAFSLGIGSNPTSQTFRIWAVGENRNKDALIKCYRYCQFESTGAIEGSSESGHKMINYMIDCLSDGFYPETADFIQIIGEDV